MFPRAVLGCIVGATLTLVVAECAFAQAGVASRPDTRPVPGFVWHPMRLQLKPADFESDAAWLGLRGDVASVTHRLDMNSNGAGEFVVGEVTSYQFDEAGNISRETRAENEQQGENAPVVTVVQNDYEKGVGSSRSAMKFGSDGTGSGRTYVFARDLQNRITGIDCAQSDFSKVRIDYAADGSVRRVVQLHEGGGGDAWTYDASGNLEAWSLVDGEGEAAEDQPAETPRMKCVWKEPHKVAVVNADPRGPELTLMDVELDDSGSIVRWSGLMGGPAPVRMERAITRDEHGNWVEILETISFPGKEPMAWRRAVQTIKYRDEAPPAEPKPQP